MSTDLAGWTVLVVEDEPLIALDLELTITDAGGRVSGPAHSEAQAMAEIDSALSRDKRSVPFDAAVLDVHLGTQTSEAVATRLFALGVPFLFHTGHARRDDPFIIRMNAPMLRKPVSAAALVAAIVASAGTRDMRADRSNG